MDSAIELQERCMKTLHYGTWLKNEGRINQTEFYQGVHHQAEELARYLEVPIPPVENCDRWILENLDEVNPIPIPSAFSGDPFNDLHSELPY